MNLDLSFNAFGDIANSHEADLSFCVQWCWDNQALCVTTPLHPTSPHFTSLSRPCRHRVDFTIAGPKRRLSFAGARSRGEQHPCGGHQGSGVCLGNWSGKPHILWSCCLPHRRCVCWLKHVIVFKTTISVAPAFWHMFRVQVSLLEGSETLKALLLNGEF